MVKLMTSGNVCLWGAFVMACVLSLNARAENLPDPTRPPAELNVVAGPAGNVEDKWVLQSVLLSPSIKSAIIGGQTVDFGERYRGAQLVKISETEVVLQTGSALRTLKLFPDLVKQPAGQSENAVQKTPPSVPRRHSGKKAGRGLTGKAE